MKLMHFFTALGAAAMLSPAAAFAATIAFDPLAGSNGDAYTGHSEAGFDISVTEGAWQEAQFFGNPVPAIFSTSASAGIRITASSGTDFTFSGVDLANANFNAGEPGYAIEGLLDGGAVFSIVGSILSKASFESILNAVSDAVIDELLITMTAGGTSSYNIDNIGVALADEPNAIPLPAAGFLLLAALGGLGLAGRRRPA